MKLNIYKNQKEIEKTFECDTYDIMYGTVEDMFEILDGINDGSDESLVKVISANRKKLNALIKDVFPDVTDEELRRVKVKDLIPFFTDLFSFISQSFGTEKN